MTTTKGLAPPPRPTENGPSRPLGTNPYVFIVGCPRSGTTLLKRMVDAHPEIGISRATYWIPKWFSSSAGA
jgi:hypothetical protein